MTIDAFCQYVARQLSMRTATEATRAMSDIEALLSDTEALVCKSGSVVDNRPRDLKRGAVVPRSEVSP